MEDFEVQYYVDTLISDGYVEDVGEVTKEQAIELLRLVKLRTNTNHLLIVNANHDGNTIYYDLVLDLNKKDEIRFEDWQL